MKASKNMLPGPSGDLAETNGFSEGPMRDGFADLARSDPSSSDSSPDTDLSEYEVEYIGPASEGIPSMPRVTLLNSHQFTSGMQMVISSAGRPMQPAPVIVISNIFKDLQYCIWLNFMKMSGDVASSFMHPNAPQPGEVWMKSPITFPKLRLYSSDKVPPAPITLVLNEWYFIQVNFAVADDHGQLLARTVIKHAFPETKFQAVAAPISKIIPKPLEARFSFGQTPAKKKKVA